MEKIQIQIRQPEPEDLNLITSTFLKSIKKESSLGRACSTRIFFSEFHKVIDHILSTSKTIIACKHDEPKIIYGYLIFSNDTIQYCFVKAAFRNLYVAKDLINAAFPNAKSISYAFATNCSKKISEKYPELIFNPFINYKKEIA